MKDKYLAKVRTYYPDAERSDELGSELIEYLCENFKLKPKSIMAANSICSDDINSMQFPNIGGSFLGPFNMGGLNGFPFTGKTGLVAFAHHVPQNGALLIFYAPHIGIPQKGEPGLVWRIGQNEHSDCCGAAVGALPKKGTKVPRPNAESLDFQMDYIKWLFYVNRKHILKDTEKWKQVINATEVMYNAIHERIGELVAWAIKENKIPHCKYLFLFGGIFINGDKKEGSFGVYKHHKVIIDPGKPKQKEQELMGSFVAYHNKMKANKR